MDYCSFMMITDWNISLLHVCIQLGNHFSPLVFYSYSDDAPHHPELCHNNLFNFFEEFPYWEEWIQRVDDSSFMEALIELANSTHGMPLPVNISEMIASIPEDIKLFELVGKQSVQDCQEALFDLPFYFVGKWVIDNISTKWFCMLLM